MTTFDGWEGEVHPPEDYLMHFRTKGSKNGVRRYQTPSGEWTELGLRERRKREGFGESKAERKAQKRIAKAEKRLARRAAKAERKADRAEAKRKRSLKGLTDEEMKSKLERAKMEAEYKELKRRGTLIETGSNLVAKYLDYRDKKAQREIDINRQKIDMKRAEADIVRAKEGTKRAKAEADKAKEERKKVKQDRKAGLKKERLAELLNKKMEYKNYTIRGGIGRRINMMLTSGRGKKYEAIQKAKGDKRANRIRSDAERDLKNRKKTQEHEDSAKERERASTMYYDQRERERKNRKQYEKEAKRLRKKFGSSNGAVSPRL